MQPTLNSRIMKWSKVLYFYVRSVLMQTQDVIRLTARQGKEAN